MTDTLTQRARDVAGRLEASYGWMTRDQLETALTAAAIISELVEREQVRQDALLDIADYAGEVYLAWVESGCDSADAIATMGAISQRARSHAEPLPQPPSVLGKQEGEG